MKKRVKVIMLPTDDYTGIILHGTGLDPFHYTIKSRINAVKNIGGKCQHLYGITDEEIKEGDWQIITINTPNGDIIDSICRHTKDGKGGGKKVVVTTDKSLLCDSCTTDKDYRHNFSVCKCENVKLIPQSFIEEYCKVGGIDEIDIELENWQTNNIWSEIIGEYITTLISYTIKTDKDNCVIIHPIEPRLYTKEEVEQMLHEVGMDSFKQGIETTKAGGVSRGDFTVTDWIKENLK